MEKNINLVELSSMLEAICKNSGTIKDLKVADSIVKDTLTSILNAAAEVSRTAFEGANAQIQGKKSEGKQGKLSFQEPANTKKDTKIPDNKPANTPATDAVDEANKVELEAAREEAAREGDKTILLFIQKQIDEKDYKSARATINAELKITPDRPELVAFLSQIEELEKSVTTEKETTDETPVVDAETSVGSEVKDTISDPHASSRMSAEDAHDYIKTLVAEMHQEGKKMNEKDVRGKLLLDIKTSFPANDPCVAETKEGHKLRNGLLDVIFKEVVQEAKEALASKEENKVKETVSNVSSLIAEAESELKTEKKPTPVIQLNVENQEKTKVVSAEEIAKASEGEEEFDLATCSLADFKMEITKDYDGITAEAEYDPSSERFKKWVELVNARTNADSNNIKSTSTRPNAAVNFMKSILGNIKKQELHKAKLAEKKAA